MTYYYYYIYTEERGICKPFCSSVCYWVNRFLFCPHWLLLCSKTV